MKGKKEFATAKRFGVRYGSTSRHKFAELEQQHRSFHQCPYCRNKKVKRVAVGIWKCRKCNAKFTGKAYAVKKEEKTEK